MSQASEATSVHPASGAARRSNAARQRKNYIFVGICLVTAMFSLVILAVLLIAIVVLGRQYLTVGFLNRPPSPNPDEAGIGPALWGTVWVCTGCALFALPLGVGTAIFLEEFKPRFALLRWFHAIIQLNISNLAGVPSVVYGIIGLTAFASMFGLFDPAPPPDIANMDRAELLTLVSNRNLAIENKDDLDEGELRQAVGVALEKYNQKLEIGVQYYYQFLSEGDRILLVPAGDRTAETIEYAPDMKFLDSEDMKPVEVTIIGAIDPLPEDEALHATTLRDDAVGGRIVRRRFYYLSLPFGRGVLTGALTLMLVVLPIVIIASQEALRAVPDSLREGAFGMGATRWQMVWNVTLPASIPGIMTGSILAMSRAIGEAAPILMIAGIVYIANAPGHLMDDFSVMPLQIYNWAGRPQVAFHHLAASGIIVLLVLLLSFNALAVIIRQTLQKPLS